MRGVGALRSLRWESDGQPVQQDDARGSKEIRLMFVLIFLLGGTSTNVINLLGIALVVSLSVWIASSLIEFSRRKKRKGKRMVDDTVRELEGILKQVTPKLNIISDSESSVRPSTGKWSRKEILGHLIDSASNNHQRFVRGQLSSEIKLGGYEQERWVNSQAYQNEAWTNLVSLWNSYNRHLSHVLSVIPEEKLENNCFIGENEPVTLEFLIKDYLRHLKHHLDQIMGGW
jgi:hypothetical protein